MLEIQYLLIQANLPELNIQNLSCLHSHDIDQHTLGNYKITDPVTFRCYFIMVTPAAVSLLAVYAVNYSSSSGLKVEAMLHIQMLFLLVKWTVDYMIEFLILELSGG